LYQRSGEAVDAIDDGPVDDVDASIDRTGCAVAGRYERANAVVVQDNAIKSVAGNIGAQCHVNEAGACAPDQIEKIEIEKRIAVEKQKALVQQTSRVG